jgi:Flp pilus assembly protein TadG
MASGIELGRYFYARAEIAKAANAAVLAAAAEINQRVYESNGNLTPTAQIWANGQALANMNNGYLAKYGVNPAVTGIVVDDAKDKVSVQVSAGVNRLFPGVLPDLIISENGAPQIRVITK